MTQRTTRTQATPKARMSSLKSRGGLHLWAFDRRAIEEPV